MIKDFTITCLNCDADDIKIKTTFENIGSSKSKIELKTMLYCSNCSWFEEIKEEDKQY